MKWFWWWNCILAVTKSVQCYVSSRFSASDILWTMKVFNRIVARLSTTATIIHTELTNWYCTLARCAIYIYIFFFKHAETYTFVIHSSMYVRCSAECIHTNCFVRRHTYLYVKCFNQYNRRLDHGTANQRQRFSHRVERFNKLHLLGV